MYTTQQQASDLATDRDLLLACAELSPTPEWIVSEDRIAFVNHAALQLLGAADATQILDRRAADFFDFLPGVQPGAAHPRMAAMFRLDGSRVDVQVILKPFFYREQPAVFVSITPLEKSVWIQTLDAVLSTVKNALTVFDDDWRVIYANSSAAHLYGHPVHQLRGMLLWDIPGLRNADFEPTLSRAKSRNRTIRFENQDASGVWFENFAYPLDEGVALLRRETTHCEAVQTNRKESEIIYRAIGDSIDYGVWVCDAIGRNLYVSESFLRLTGLTQKECLDFGWLQALRPHEAEGLLATWKKCVASGANFDAEYWIRGDDGEWTPVLSRGAPVRNDAGEIIYWAGINLDIRAFKAAQQALEDNNEALARSNQELEQFAFTASHDMQEPLRVIRLMANLLERRYRGKFDQDGADYLSTIEESAARMSYMVSDLLDYARVLHTQPPKGVTCDLNAALAIALQNCQPRIDESNAVVRTGRLPKAMADPQQVARVFQNLITNAIKYRSDATPEITIEADQRGVEWRICVADNGRGIPSNLAHQVFRPFGRLHGQEIPGSGLGLAVCKKIVERHGGRMWVESAGQGSRFYFTLPIE